VRAACFSLSYFFVWRAHRRRESLLLQDPPSWVVRACGKCRAHRDMNKQALVFNSFNVFLILPYITMPIGMFVSTDTHTSARTRPYACIPLCLHAHTQADSSHVLSGYSSACEKLFSSSSEFTWIIPGLRAWVPPPSPQYCGVFRSFTNCSFSKLSWTGNRCRPRREGSEGETERVRRSQGKGRFGFFIIITSSE
jgi:hypothetical protein